ncbi:MULTISPECIES: DUF1993 family protein [unclassified Mesorhizobium]|uniref:DUF1993 domain-containing protein n=1 Tax=unclassified Mesorhizobium TaxID=325217 RepID=UPI0007012C4C|nr:MULTISPECIES: DUF1993 domain-containing protein [unclassified Mesorhizobium]KQZ12996.1 hypothetical protein ASD27_02110 [Mesorhizobium sp. Root1471]KQZ35515.1 hypothetical protein ASD44_02105 [Mesorhizobium sp. Root554]MDR7031763.1 hypothetical protein [Mesorhizobium sp. BE184]
MSLSLYDITIPVFIHGLKTLSVNLEKGRSFAIANGMAHGEIISARLFPDMAPLSAQIQRASDTVRFVAVRVAQAEPKKMPDYEETFDELKGRIKATIDYLNLVKPDSMNGKENEPVVLKFGDRQLDLTAASYIQKFALPNFYFHLTTAYGIMRHKGVPLGKLDFIGAIA